MNKNYIDITKELLSHSTPNNHEVKELMYFIDKDGVKHNVDGKNVVLDYSSKEKDIAEFILKTFGGEIFMLPRINIPWGIKTPDYLWNNEYWDLKEIKSSGKQAIDNRINDSKGQANNFILDITGNKLSNLNLLSQIDKIYQSKSRKWVSKIIIIKNNKLIKAFKRK